MEGKKMEGKADYNFNAKSFASFTLTVYSKKFLKNEYGKFNTYFLSQINKAY